MKYTILIPQKQVVDAGLHESTDLIDWAIIDYISRFYLSPNAKRYQDHVWINLKTLSSEMPMLGLKTKQAVSKRIVKLRELGLITCVYDEFTRMYAKITEVCYQVAFISEGVNQNMTGCQRNDDGGVNQNMTGCQPEHDINQTINTKPLSTNIPDDFKISESVQAWADSNGHKMLDEHLESFVLYAKRSGKKYVDWDSAFKTAIRENWGKVSATKPVADATFEDYRKQGERIVAARRARL